MPHSSRVKPVNGHKIAPGIKRNYDAAVMGRLQADWAIDSGDANWLLRSQHSTIRDRAREQERNSDLARSFIRLVLNNVVGDAGIIHRADVRKPDGAPDEIINDQIEAAFRAWGTRQYCTVSEEYCLWELDRLVLRSAVRDGVCLVRIWTGPSEGPWGFRLQPLEIDYLAVDLTQYTRQDGTTIEDGIERDSRGRVTAYYLWQSRPGHGVNTTNRVLRVPAGEIIRVMMPDRIAQNVAPCWWASSMSRIRHLSRYEEAEVVRARIAACKMGFIKPQAPDDYLGNNEDMTINVSPGNFEKLPPGCEVEAWNVEAPSSNYDAFLKTNSRQIAAGMGVSYESLTGDRESVNFSSIRSGVLEDRVQYKVLQRWYTENFRETWYRRWLEMAILTGKLPLQIEDLDRLSAVVWRGRRWDWVDPGKDLLATEKAIGLGLKTREEVLSEQGDKDWMDTMEQLAKEKDLADKLGIKVDAVEYVAAVDLQAEEAADDAEKSEEIDKDEEVDKPETSEVSS